MTPDQGIALGSSIGACLSALATFWTVREMTKQRAASYRPELVLTRIQFTGTTEEPLRLPTKWEIVTTESGASVRTPAAMSLSNVGLGSAKDLRFLWSFNFHEVATTFNDLATRGEVGVEMRIKENGSIAVEMKDRRSFIFSWQDQGRYAVDYLLPSATRADSEPLPLPKGYIEAISALIVVSGGAKPVQGFPQIPPLTLAIDYTDIADVLHKERFDIKLDFSMIVGNGEMFDATLTAKRSA